MGTEHRAAGPCHSKGPSLCASPGFSSPLTGVCGLMADGAHPCSTQPALSCTAGLRDRAQGVEEGCQGLGSSLCSVFLLWLFFTYLRFVFAELVEGNVLLSPLRKPFGYWADLCA